MTEANQVPDGAVPTETQITEIVFRTQETRIRATASYAWYSRDAEILEMEQDIDQLEATHKAELAKLQEQLNGYKMENEEMRENYGLTQEALTATREQLEQLVGAAHLVRQAHQLLVIRGDEVRTCDCLACDTTTIAIAKVKEYQEAQDGE